MLRTAFHFLALLALAIAWPARAESAAGIYDGGQTEIAAVLQLEPDGRFAYRLSYGALDEFSRGTWREVDGGVVLTSDPVIAPVFELVSSSKGNSDRLQINLDKPDGLPGELFSALVTLEDGSSFVEDFGSDGLELSLGGQARVAGLTLALPLFEAVSDAFRVEPETVAMNFRFVPNDLGVLALDDVFLPREDGVLKLERFDRTLRFLKVEPGPEQD